MRVVSVAIVDDFELVVRGVADMLSQFPDRIEIRDLSTNGLPDSPVCVALIDTFGQDEAHRLDLGEIVASDLFEHVVVYSWSTDESLVERALSSGASGYLSKALSAQDLAHALESVADGVRVVELGTNGPGRLERRWPGRDAGLTEREAEVLAILLEGDANATIADRLYISVNTVRSHLQSIYRKLGVDNRTQAVRAATDLGFETKTVTERWFG